MTELPREAGACPVPRETYERLAAATPAERSAIVRGLIEAHPEKRLELPARDGLHAVLDGLELGPDGADLRRANLQGASLRDAVLGAARLSGADLRGASMGGARLDQASLDGADLRGADLAAASLSGVVLAGADLRGAMLEETDLRGATLRFAKLGEAVLEDARLDKADAWGADFRGAVLTGADLRGAVLEEARLGGSDLSGANLQEVVLRRADLRDAKLVGADLRGAVMTHAVLRGAVLRDAKLQGLELTHCDLAHVHLSGARLDEARFDRSQLGGAIGEELAGECEQARGGYLALERAFEDLGDHEAASWAYRRRRRMQKHVALQQARTARADRQWGQAVRWYAVYTGDQLAEWVCDYGESIPRVLASLLVLYLVFTVVYGLTGSVVREQETPNGVVKVTTRNPADLAIFGLLAMTTGSIGINLLPAHDLALLLVGIHVFLGVALIGLLGFVLGNRIRR